MLADQLSISAKSGLLNESLYPLGTFLSETFESIANLLPLWRDDPQRPQCQAEVLLTEYLCDYLTQACRKAPGFDNLQFRNEAADQKKRSRRTDVAIKPCETITIEGRNYNKYDTIVQIECKRLPTPKDSKRDEREYVFSEHRTVGGIQRFKQGHHGSNHNVAAMIAYVQEGTRQDWKTSITEWIKGLVKEQCAGWSDSDLLQTIRDDDNTGISVLESEHVREGNLLPIVLHHLWMEMDH